MSVVVGQRNIRNTSFNNKCYAVDFALDLAQHTLKICANENIFTSEFKPTVTDRITNTVTNIYLNAFMANKIYVDKDVRKWNERDSRQRAAILQCDELLALINLAKRTFHLRTNKVGYWVKKTVSTRELLKKWNDSDYERYYKL